MKRLTLSILLIVSMLLCSCGNRASEQPATSAATEASTDRFLTIKNEIGVELGDSNFVFGVIQDVDITLDGNCAILDSQKKRVRIFSPEGDFLGSFGGQGEAPGEFLNPRSVACLHDGRIAVSDPFSREVEIFNSDFSHSETVSDFSERAPFVITATETGFAGEQGGFNRDMGTITVRIVAWNLETASKTILFEKEDNFSPENLVERFMKPVAGIAASNDIIYYSPPETDEYAVYLYPMDGSSSGILSFPGYSPAGKSEEDIQAEIEMYEDRMQAMASSGRGARLAEAGYNPPEHYYATAALGIDSDNFVWVQRGWESEPVFDLFKNGDSTPSETVRVSDEINLSGYSFVITPYGIAAFHPDPEDYPRVYLLEVE